MAISRLRSNPDAACQAVLPRPGNSPGLFYCACRGKQLCRCPANAESQNSKTRQVRSKEVVHFIVSSRWLRNEWPRSFSSIPGRRSAERNRSGMERDLATEASGCPSGLRGCARSLRGTIPRAVDEGTRSQPRAPSRAQTATSTCGVGGATRLPAALRRIHDLLLLQLDLDVCLTKNLRQAMLKLA